MIMKPCILALLSLFPIGQLMGETRPNVILIMTDDQGIGDFGCTGNPVLKTPHVDAMAKRSLRMQRFYVSPVCAPTRASLMTGRYNYRTRVVDTFNGRAMMEPTEITLAEILRDNGYRTGIFGKWHLGDCYPMRSIDQGFERSVVHRGGGIGQSSDPIAAAGKYTDPILIEDGVPQQFKGYCTDIYYENAFQFIRECAHDKKPFFVYLPDNCPHGPFNDVPKDWMDHYKTVDVGNDQFPESQGESLGKQANIQKRRQIFSMISNIDDNIGKLYNVLDELALRKNTIVIFMTDNGPNGNRYRCSLRGTKTSVYEGGIRTLFLWDWPVLGDNQRSSNTVAAHIDLLPTILQACQIAVPNIKLDGRSFFSVVKDPGHQLSDRTLFIQTHRGNQPVAYHHFAAIGERWKLVNHSGFGKEVLNGEPEFELFDLQNDPFEMKDVSHEHPEIVQQLKAEYDVWFHDVSRTREDNYNIPLIQIGSSHEPVTLLSRQDLRKSPSHGDPGKIRGQWLLGNRSDGPYRVTIHFQKNFDGPTATLHCNDQQFTGELKLDAPGPAKLTFDEIDLRKGQIKLWVTSPRQKSDNLAYQVELEAL